MIRMYMHTGSVSFNTSFLGVPVRQHVYIVGASQTEIWCYQWVWYGNSSRSWHQGSLRSP